MLVNTWGAVNSWIADNIELTTKDITTLVKVDSVDAVRYTTLLMSDITIGVSTDSVGAIRYTSLSAIDATINTGVDLVRLKSQLPLFSSSDVRLVNFTAKYRLNNKTAKYRIR